MIFFLFSHCSTDAVFPHGLSNCSEDADMKEYASQLDDGYILRIQNLKNYRHYSIEQNFTLVICFTLNILEC